jgi:hypothetical protein
MTKEFTLNKTHLKHALLLVALLAAVFVVDALADRDARAATNAATDSVADLFRIDFRRGIAGQLPPCTETGRDFWTLHLTTIRDTIEASGATIQGVDAERDGSPQPYIGLAGEGQIVPVKLVIRSRNEGGEIETSESHVRVLMIKGGNGDWLLDSLAPDLPSQSRRPGGFL